MTKVKICGINSPAAFDAAVEAGADYLGFVFFPPSPRSLTAAEAADLSERHADGPRRVGLFVDPTDDAIAAVLTVLPLDILQLYTAPARAATIRARFGIPVWRAVSVAGPTDLPAAADGADALLLEAKAPEGASRPGGNARSFDWSLLRGWVAPAPWVLGGGLNPANVAAAVRTTGAPVVDVSSGVETAPGVKDPALIRAFIAAARAA